MQTLVSDYCVKQRQTSPKGKVVIKTNKQDMGQVIYNKTRTRQGLNFCGALWDVLEHKHSGALERFGD